MICKKLASVQVSRERRQGGVLRVCNGSASFTGRDGGHQDCVAAFDRRPPRNRTHAALDKHVGLLVAGK
eukprot:scaffold121065_cov75-Phaeocystis_antarctica.AAC.2